MNIFLTKSISCVVTQTLKKIKAEFSRKTRHKITRTQHAAVKKSTFEETHTIKLLLGQAQPLGKHLVLEEQHGLGLHEGAVLLVLRPGEVLAQHVGHHRPPLLDAGLQGLGLIHLIQQLLTFVLYCRLHYKYTIISSGDGGKKVINIGKKSRCFVCSLCLL